MRAGLWCGTALALLAVACALRTPQVEDTSRGGRRLSVSSTADTRLGNEAEEVPTFRPRISRRREEILGRERTRTRSRPTAAPSVSTASPQPQHNERFDSRRTYSRTRNRPVEVANDVPNARNNVIHSRTRNHEIRQSGRRTTQPAQTAEVKSSKIEEIKTEVYKPSEENLPRITTFRPTSTSIDDPSTQYKRRSSTTTESVTPTRRRGRINTRVDTKALDLSVSGTTNTLTVSHKEPTTARTSEDLRSSRKLRYKTRLTETDTNPTGEGISIKEEVKKSSQIKENITSQSEFQTVTSAAETTTQLSTEAPLIKPEPTTATKVVRRPLTRGKVNFRPAVSISKAKTSDEISEDDNYPESFKALIQAKNSSTQTSSPTSESLSVKASQKVYNTYTSSSQPTNTDPAINKYSRFRSKISAQDKSAREESEKEGKEEDKSQSNIIPDPPNQREPQYKPRNTYNPRSRKPFSTSTTTSSSVSNQGTDRPLYKFNRKFKPSTTEAPKFNNSSKYKRIGTNSLLKKSLPRSSYYSRRNISSSLETSSETVIPETSHSNTNNVKAILPMTSYYSRLRNKKNNGSSSSTTTTEASTEVLQTPAENKMENTVDMPLIFSLLKNSAETESQKNEELQTTKETDRQKKMFIIAVTSKESIENSTENEVTEKSQEVENKIVLNTVSPASKYHANFKTNDPDNLSENKDQAVQEATPPIRNIQTKKNGRKRVKTDLYDEVPEVTPRTKERNLRKYSDGFVKSTEPSTNGIPPETEKQKSRFSSKYRSSYLDKPYYRPTVPTVTPSTAWLKFFVTDPQLAKSVEEPYWFEGEDIYVTTEMSRKNATAPSVIHESSLELVEGEEVQLGPDMNAISFTKTRSTLSSADLRLSESLTKPSHTMNVEASQHSPSVTVSIFDALAEILTSTPRTPRLSSTTEVTKKHTINDIQTLNGVSNSITVNNVRGLASQDTFTTIADVNSNTKFVQTTAPTTPTVINRSSVVEAVTPSLNTQDGKVTSVNTPTPPTPPPTTPVSARRPFAIKVLYTDTDPTTDIPTATESPRTSNLPSTDNPTVLNTVSDLLLINNNFVSSELTSMLSNNIKNIIENMDDEAKSKISADMAKLLKSLIPRALNGLTNVNNDDVDISPNTTPYSLEEIRDTGNVDIHNKNSDVNIKSTSLPQTTVDNDVDIVTFGTTINIDIDNKDPNDDDDDIDSSDSLQTVVTERIVNSKGTTQGLTETPLQAVNSNSPLGTSSTLPVSSSQTTITDATYTLTTTPLSTLSLQSTSAMTTINFTSNPSTVTSSASLDTESVIIGNGNRLGDSLDNTNPNLPLPFFTNFEIRDFTPNDSGEIDSITSTTRANPIPLTKSITPSNNRNVQSQVSPLQLWVLSKKAQVLKMIEDLIKQHNDEIATAQPMTELLNQPNNIPLSNRLTQILNTMSSTTESTDETTESATLPVTPSLSPFPLLSTQNDANSFPPTITTQALIDELLSTTELVPDIFSRLTFTGSDTESNQASTESIETSGTMPSVTSQDIESSNTLEDDVTTTTSANTETTTDSTNTEMAQTTTEVISTMNVNTTTQTDTAKTTSKSETNQTLVSVNSNTITVANQTPKKDYVIFGILPNNTVVRKDPNEDVLESLTEASPYIVYSLLPNNTVIRRFPNGTRVPRVMQKIDVLPISPWSLKNPYSPIHNNPAIVRPHNPIRVSTNLVTSTDTFNNGTENRLTNDTVNNQQQMIPSTLNIKDRSSLVVTTATNKPPAEKSTASHVLSLRTTTMLPSVDEILLNSISSAVKEEMFISSMTSSTHEPRILTLDIDPETKEIRTEKPSDGSGGTVFKYIPIDEVTVASQDTNLPILKLASTRAPAQNTEMPTQTPQIQTRIEIPETTTTVIMTAGTPIESSTSSFTTDLPKFEKTSSPITTAVPITTTVWTTTEAPTTNTMTEATTTTFAPTTTTTLAPTTTPVVINTMPTTTKLLMTSASDTTVTSLPSLTTVDFENRFQDDSKLLASLFGAERDPKSLNTFNTNNQVTSNIFTTTASPTTKAMQTKTDLSEEAKLLQSLLAGNQNPSTLSIPNIAGNIRVSTGAQPTTSRSIEDDIRQFEEDTKLLKALLAATGQNPANLNIPSLENLNIPRVTTTQIPTTITTQRPTTTAPPTTSTTQTPSTSARGQTTTQSINDDIRKLTEDAKLLQALLQATGNSNTDIPVISGITSNVRIASNPRTTSVMSVPTTPVNVRPVYTSRTTTPSAPVFTTVLTTLQPRATTTEAVGISSTLPPKERRRLPTTTVPTGRRAPVSIFTVTTEIPSTSTFSDEEDLQFLQNLKTVLKNNPSDDDPEAALANRIIALAVERSLNEIESGKQANDGRTGKSFATTLPITTTTTTSTTTTVQPTTDKDNTPSFEEDIKQFQEDTKLLQALLKATGQDPSKFNIPTLPSVDINTKVSANSLSPSSDLNLLTNLRASSSPLNKPLNPITTKPSPPTTPRPFGAKIAVKDDLKNEKDDAKLLQTLVKLQGVQETTTQRSKLAITGQSSDEALKKLIQQTKPAGMVSEATKAPVSISTEYGKSNDALLAALLKEQGFGPTTASSLDEQLRLAALLNQVVVTPKARRTTTPPPPPPPPPRRPILDGLAWLWQQWRETAPGPAAPRPNRRPSIPSGPASSAPTNNWFGSGPFVGNADDDRPTSNRVPLEPPRAVVAEQTPGRGQLVSAAINVTRAFSQFLGAAIAGAAQTVQSVIRAGQRAATDAYSTGSG